MTPDSFDPEALADAMARLVSQRPPGNKSELAGLNSFLDQLRATHDRIPFGDADLAQLARTQKKLAAIDQSGQHAAPQIERNVSAESGNLNIAA